MLEKIENKWKRSWPIKKLVDLIYAKIILKSILTTATDRYIHLTRMFLIVILTEIVYK